MNAGSVATGWLIRVMDLPFSKRSRSSRSVGVAVTEASKSFAKMGKASTEAWRLYRTKYCQFLLGGARMAVGRPWELIRSSYRFEPLAMRSMVCLVSSSRINRLKSVRDIRPPDTSRSDFWICSPESLPSTNRCRKVVTAWSSKWIPRRLASATRSFLSRMRSGLFAGEIPT